MPNNFARGLVHRGARAADVEDEQISFDERGAGKAPPRPASVEFLQQVFLPNHFAIGGLETKQVPAFADRVNPPALDTGRGARTAFVVDRFERARVSMFPDLL